jgi:hypothetical protein
MRITPGSPRITLSEKSGSILGSLPGSDHTSRCNPADDEGEREGEGERHRHLD